MSSTAGIPRRWTVADSAEIYGVKYWGNNFFSINDAGNVQSHPAGPENGRIDLKELVDEVARRGIGLPLLIRFSDVLKSRIVELNETFRRAIAEYGYKGQYKGVYPIKVNQHRYVVEEIVQFGRPYHYGLEAAPLPSWSSDMLDDEEAPTVHPVTATRTRTSRWPSWPRSAGRTVLIVAYEKFSELSPCRGRQDGCAPAHRRARQAGRQGPGALGGLGRRSLEVRPVDQRGRRGHQLHAGQRSARFELLHFHLGSQIHCAVKALREAGRFYVEVAKLGAPSS